MDTDEGRHHNAVWCIQRLVPLLFSIIESAPTTTSSFFPNYADEVYPIKFSLAEITWVLAPTPITRKSVHNKSVHNIEKPF